MKKDNKKGFAVIGVHANPPHSRQESDERIIYP
jgi:hypothetical protein